jgi:hypothetical protein
LAQAPAPAQGLGDAALAQPRAEARLLHHVVRAIDLGSNLRIFDARTGEWLRTASSDPPAARALLVYLFSPAAPIAVSELPWLREMARRIEGHHGGEARVLFVAESASADSMKTFLAGLPRTGSSDVGAPLFLDQEGSLAEPLREKLPGAELPLPITLLLDDQHVVRQAFIGSLAGRRSEIVSAVSELLYELRITRGHHQ